MKVIIVSGTPATGKTSVAQEIAKRMGYDYIDVNMVIKENGLAGSYDRKRKCHAIDIKKLNRELVRIIKRSKKSIVIDSHLSHHLPKEYVDVCIITKSGLKTLKKRLEKRGYGREKVRENLDAEIFDVCMAEAKEMGHKVIAVDTSKRFSINKLVNSF